VVPGDTRLLAKRPSACGRIPARSGDLACLPATGQNDLEEDAVRINELILWLSARVQGSWEQFKAAVEELHLPDDEQADLPEEDSRQGGLPLHQELRFMLERLGHVEFFAAGCEGGWRIAPPVWAALGAADAPSAVLCGARTLPLLARVRSAKASPAELHVDEDAAAPSIFRLTASSREELLSAAVATGIAVQLDAPRAMLCAQPRVCDAYEEIADLPLGRDWIVEQFNAESLRWKPSSREQGRSARDGLFRFRLPYQRRHFLRRRGHSYEMEGAAAKYALLHRARCHVFRYVPTSKACVVPATCRPPTLIERALILCSGRLPMFEASGATLTYGSVSADIARLAARLLDQEIVA
jgi:hypothetical protein